MHAAHASIHVGTHRCDACRTAHWCSHACFAEDDDEGKGGVHALLCPRLRRVRQRGLLKGTGAAALAVEGETIRLTMQVGMRVLGPFSLKKSE